MQYRQQSAPMPPEALIKKKDEKEFNNYIEDSNSPNAKAASMAKNFSGLKGTQLLKISKQKIEDS